MTPTQNALVTNDDDDATVKIDHFERHFSISNIQLSSTIFPSRAKAWSRMATHLHTDKSIGRHTIMETAKIKIAIDMAIADAGATAYFAVPGAPVINQKVTTTPLIINLPDGKQLQSTHTCELDIHWLPKAARKAHIVPGLMHTLLISIKTLYKTGCKVSYDDEKCKVYFKHRLVWHSDYEPTTGLWVLPLQPTQKALPSMCTTLEAESQLHCATNVFANTSKAVLI